MKVALFGGSFDPPHIGHLKIIEKSLKKLKIDRLVVMPTYLNPFKKEFFAEPSLRLLWLNKMCVKLKNVIVSDFEIKQNRAVYTIESVEYLNSIGLKVKYLVIGADNLKRLKRWNSYFKLKKSVKFVVATRGGIAIPSHFKKLHIKADVSSQDIRNKKKRYIPKTIKQNIKKYYKERYGKARENQSSFRG